MAELLPVASITDLETLGPAETLEAYRARGGYQALRRALTMSGPEIVAEIREAGLTGRGGAGFPTAAKWEATARGRAPRYLVVTVPRGSRAPTRTGIS